jgi:MFS family permease
LFFGIGFAVGPLMTPLVNISLSLPFIISSAMCLVGWVFIFALKNEYPENDEGIGGLKDTGKRFGQALKYGWVAFLPPLAYGFLESSLNGIFPVYALRSGIEVSEVSILLTSFAVGGIITQLPLGILSDRFGRRKVLIVILFLGFTSFSAASFLEESFLGLFICFLSAGMVVGSTFSLGIAFMTDIMPKNLLPTGNLLCGIAFSLGSLTGPSIGGVIIQAFKQISFFHIVSTLLFSIFLVIVVFGKRMKVNLASEKSA